MVLVAFSKFVRGSPGVFRFRDPKPESPEPLEPLNIKSAVLYVVLTLHDALSPVFCTHALCYYVCHSTATVLPQLAAASRTSQPIQENPTC